MIWSIFTCFWAVNHWSLYIYIDFIYGWQKCQPQYKNIWKTKFLEAYNSETKSHKHIVSIQKKSYFDVLFQILSNIFNFLFSDDSVVPKLIQNLWRLWYWFVISWPISWVKVTVSPESVGFLVLISFSIGESDRSKSNRDSEDNAFLHIFHQGEGGTENKLNGLSWINRILK